MNYDFALLEEIRASLRGVEEHPCYECGSPVDVRTQPCTPCPGCLRIICQDCYHNGYYHWPDRLESNGQRPCMRGYICDYDATFGGGGDPCGDP
jgi:hypothetical protein